MEVSLPVFYVVESWHSYLLSHFVMLCMLLCLVLRVLDSRERRGVVLPEGV